MTNPDALVLLSKKISLDGQSSVLSQALRIAIYDEYEAFETYKAILATHDVKTPFTNIMQAEVKHFEALIGLCKKYEVTPPLNDLVGTIKAPKSVQECYELGVAIEIDNIAMYDYLIPFISEYPDVLDTFYRLQAASINNHLPALRSHVQNSSNEDIMSKFGDVASIASKIQNGEFDPSDIMGLVNDKNISLLVGMLLGGLGGYSLNSFLKTKDKDEKE